MSENKILFEEPLEPRHPVFPAPSREVAAAVLAEHGGAALAKVLKARNEAIRAEKEHPLEYGFELPTWVLADLFLGFIDWTTFVTRIERLAGVAWCPVIAADLREWTQDEEMKAAAAAGPYQLCLLLGGNQAAKTEYMIKRAVGHARKFDNAQVWLFHESGQMSVDYHQARTWYYLPGDWRNAGKGRIGYVSWKKQTGFSDYKLTGPNGSLISFRNYEQREDTIEGGEIGDPLERRCIGFAADELLPLNWLKTLRFRLTRRSATGIVGFTPKYGYSDTVAWFLDGARVVRAEPARELRKAVPVPLVRVGRKDDESHLQKVIINFHSRYNRYPTANSYDNLVSMVAEDNDATRAIRLYGHTEKSRQDLFTKLSERVHGFAGDGNNAHDRRMPGVGTNYMWMDPTGVERNWFFLWGRVDVWGRLWIYREWPSPRQAVPGVGLPGAWAEPGSDARHKLGGVPGPGSRSVGFGLKDYKAEVARLEGWADVQTDKPVEDWSDREGSKEKLYMRYMDKRFGNTAHDRASGATTLQDELAELGMWFELVTGHGSQDGRTPINHGIDLINDALSFQEGWQELDILGQVQLGPKLFVSVECENLWFSLKHYTALGGYSEATKDPIDCLRYAIHSKPCYVADGFRGGNAGGAAPRGYGSSGAGGKAKGERRKWKEIKG